MRFDEIGNRMKENYESRAGAYLTRRTPVIIRIDGKAFHTFTRGFKKPFDDILMESMKQTMKFLCENIQGCVFGYTQSDEISLLLIDYKKLNSSAWFDYKTQKVCSISASLATMQFNKVFQMYSNAAIKMYDESFDNKDLINAYKAASEKGAMFDARCFNIPKEEVTNYFIWRQLDAERNSVEMVGQAYFSSRQLHKKSCKDIVEMLSDKGINYYGYPIECQRGSCCFKTSTTVDTEEGQFQRSMMTINSSMDRFLEDRSLIEKLIQEEE